MYPSHPRGRGITSYGYSNNPGTATVQTHTTVPAAPALCTCCPVHGEELSHQLTHAIKRLGEAIEVLAALTPKRPYQELIVLGSGGYIVKNYGRRHIRIWVSAAVTINVSDLLTPVLLSPGWNPLDVPELSVITGPAGTNARFEATDYDIA